MSKRSAVLAVLAVAMLMSTAAPTLVTAGSPSHSVAASSTPPPPVTRTLSDPVLVNHSFATGQGSGAESRLFMYFNRTAPTDTLVVTGYLNSVFCPGSNTEIRVWNKTNPLQLTKLHCASGVSMNVELYYYPAVLPLDYNLLEYHWTANNLLQMQATAWRGMNVSEAPVFTQDGAGVCSAATVLDPTFSPALNHTVAYTYVAQSVCAVEWQNVTAVAGVGATAHALDGLNTCTVFPPQGFSGQCLTTAYIGTGGTQISFSIGAHQKNWMVGHLILNGSAPLVPAPPWTNGTFNNTEVVNGCIQLTPGSIGGTWTSNIFVNQTTFITDINMTYTGSSATRFVSGISVLDGFGATLWRQNTFFYGGTEYNAKVGHLQVVQWAVQIALVGDGSGSAAVCFLQVHLTGPEARPPVDWLIFVYIMVALLVIGGVAWVVIHVA